MDMENTLIHGYIEVVALVLIENTRVLVAKRPQGDTLAGLWEFPGGKIEPGESPVEALIRESYEEMGILITVNTLLTTIMYSGSPLPVKIYAYTGTRVDGEIKALAHTELRWVNEAELGCLSLVPADMEIAKEVQRLLS